MHLDSLADVLTVEKFPAIVISFACVVMSVEQRQDLSQSIEHIDSTVITCPLFVTI